MTSSPPTRGGACRDGSTESCSIELRAQYHIIKDFGYSKWETYTYTVGLEALADNTFFEFMCTITEETGDILIDSTDDMVSSIPPLTIFEFGPYGWGCSGWDRIEYVTIAVTEVEIEY